MRTISVPGRTAPLAAMLGIVLAGIPLTALAAGLDVADLAATCQAIMTRLVGSTPCGG